MVEFRVSKKNIRYFTYNGRHICSSVDPVSESEAWVKCQEKHIEGAKVIVVLGLGNGFHVVELEKRHPSARIIVIETRMEMLAPCQGLHGLDISSAEIMVAESSNILKAQTRLRKLLNGAYAVVRYRPVTNTDSKLYDSFYDLLLGRSQEAFEYHLQVRNNAMKSLSLRQRETKQDRYLGIHDLQDSLTEKASFSDYHIVKALRELVV